MTIQPAETAHIIGKEVRKRDNKDIIAAEFRINNQRDRNDHLSRSWFRLWKISKDAAALWVFSVPCFLDNSLFLRQNFERWLYFAILWRSIVLLAFFAKFLHYFWDSTPTTTSSPRRDEIPPPPAVPFQLPYPHHIGCYWFDPVSSLFSFFFGLVSDRRNNYLWGRSFVWIPTII